LQVIALVPPHVKWDLKTIAARKRTTYTRLVASVLEDFVSKEMTSGEAA
jgi:hypothetical protein